MFGAGYVKVTDEIYYNYVFNYTDHLGNIRASWAWDRRTNTLKIMEENHYYPFGLKHTAYNTELYTFVLPFDGSPGYNVPYLEQQSGKPVVNPYKYKYNGKELQDELGLNMYDYGARNYDPAIGRWMNIDPLAEEGRRWSPYNYAMNNPVYFLDPDGMLSQSFIDDLLKKSQASETKWTNNNNGTFSSNTGEQADTGESSDGDGGGDPKQASINKTGQKVLEAKKSILGKIWGTLEKREWSDPETGLTYQVNAYGTVHGLSPVGGSGMLGYLGGGGTFKVSQMAGFYIRAKTFLSGGVYTKTIQSLASLEEGTSMVKLIKGIEAEARASGAKQIVIRGVDIVEKRLIQNVDFARKLGYTVEKTTENSIKISKKL